MQERTFSVNAKISGAAAERLKRLSKWHEKSYGQIIDDLIMGVVIEEPNDLVSRMNSVENHLSDLVSKIDALLNRLAALENNSSGR